MTDVKDRESSTMLAATVDYIGGKDVIESIENIAPYLNQLNSEGLKEAEKRIKELTRIPEYRKFKREKLIISGYTYEKQLEDPTDISQE